MKTNTIILIVATVIVALGAYWYFSTGTGNDLPVTAVSAGNQAQTQFQTLTGELKNISFETKIFDNPRFKSLVNIATPVTPETVGRSDPFSPIPGVSGK